jgi:hypothetical protein
VGRVQTPAKDPRGAHLRLYKDVYSTPAWQALSFTERALYIAMRQQLMSFNNGRIIATPATLAADGFTSSSTLHKSLRALIAVGFIECVVKGRMTFGGKEASLYRFTDEECFDIPRYGLKARKASNEWKRWKTSDQAAAAIAAAHKEAKRPNHPNSKAARDTSKLRISNTKGSERESVHPFSDSHSERCEIAPIRKSNDGDASESSRKPASVLGSSRPKRRGAEAAHRSTFEHQCTVATPVLPKQPLRSGQGRLTLVPKSSDE